MNINNNNNGILNNESNTNSFLNHYENIKVSKHSSAEEIAEKYLRNKLNYEYKYINKGDYANINSSNYFEKNTDISNYKNLSKPNYVHNDEFNYLINKNKYTKYDGNCNLNYDNSLSKVSVISNTINNSALANYSNPEKDETKAYKNLIVNSNNVSKLICSSNSTNMPKLNTLNKFNEEKKNNYFMKNDFLKYEKNNINYKKMENKEKSNANHIDELLNKYNNINNSKSLKYKYNINKSYVQNEKGRNGTSDKTIFTNSLVNRTDIMNNSINDHNNYYYNNRISKYYLDDALHNSKKKNLIQRNKDYVHFLSKRNSVLKNELVVKKDLKKKKSVPAKFENTNVKNKTKTNRYSNNSFFSSFYRNVKTKYSNEVELLNSINIFNNHNIKNNDSYSIKYEKEKYKLNNNNSSNFYNSNKNLINTDNVNSNLFDASFLKSTYSDSSKIIDSPLNYDSGNLSVLSANIKKKKSDESLINDLNISGLHSNKDSIMHFKDLGNKSTIDNSIYNDNSLEKSRDVISNNINFVNYLNSNNNTKNNADNNIFLNNTSLLSKNKEAMKKSSPFAMESEFSLNFFQNKNNINDIYIENEKLKHLNDASMYLNHKEKKHNYSSDLTNNNLINKKNNYLNNNANFINVNKINMSTNAYNKIKEINNEYISSDLKYNINNTIYEKKKNNTIRDGNFVFNDEKNYIKNGNNNLKGYTESLHNAESKDNDTLVDNINNSNLNSLYFSENKLTNIFNRNIKKGLLLNTYNNNIYVTDRKKGYTGNNSKQIEQNILKVFNNNNNNITSTTAFTTAANTTSNTTSNTTPSTTINNNITNTTINNNITNSTVNNNITTNNSKTNNTNQVQNDSRKINKEKNNFSELNNINNYEDYCKYVNDSINFVPITIKNMNILLALALYFLNFNINNNSTKNKFSDEVLIKLLNKFLYCLNLKTCLLKENKINNNENKYYYIQIKQNENFSNNTLTDETKKEYKNVEEKETKNEEQKNNKENNSESTKHSNNFFTFYNKRIVKNRKEKMENTSTKYFDNKNNNDNSFKDNDNNRKKCFYLDENMKIISLIDIYKIAWSLCVLKKNFLYIDLLRILYKEVEYMNIEKELTFCITYIFKYCNIIEIEECKADLNNNIIINLENNNNENLCMYLHLLYICSLHDEKYLNNNHKKNIDKIITYFYDHIENLNLYMCTNILCVLAKLNIKNNEYPYFFNKMMNYFRSNIKKLNKSVLLVNIIWSLCICEVICSEFLKDLSEYVINILHFIPLCEFITISCSFGCQKILIIKNYYENIKKIKEVKQEQKNRVTISQESLEEYKNYELLINEYYEKKKIFPYYFYRKPICQSIIFKILAYNFLQYEQKHVNNNNIYEINTNSFQDYKSTFENNNSNNKISLDLNNEIKKTSRSLSVENKKCNMKKDKERNSPNSRYSSSNIYRNIKNNNTTSEESVSFFSSSSFYKNNNKLCDKNEHMINESSEIKDYNNNNGDDNNNNNNSNNGNILDNNNHIFYHMNNAANIITNDLKSNINKNKYFKKYNEKKKIKEYYNIYDKNNNYEFHLNSCERILFANLIEDCCNNFEELNSINLVELLYTLCILNLDKTKIVKLVEKKIDCNTFNENYEKFIKKKKYIHKNCSDKDIISEKNDLIILNYIYSKFVEEHIGSINDIDYNFSLMANNIYFCKYINDDIFLNIIKGNRESMNTSAFYKLKNILNVAAYKEKELDKINSKKNSNFSVAENEQIRELDPKEQYIGKNEKILINNQNKQTDVTHNNIKSKMDGVNNFILNEMKNGDYNENQYRDSFLDKLKHDDNNAGNYYNKNNHIYNNDIISKEKEICNIKITCNNDNMFLENYENRSEKNQIINNSNELHIDKEKKKNLYFVSNEFKNFEESPDKESDDTSRQLSELKKDLKSTYDVAIAYYNNKTKYNKMDNNKDNLFIENEGNEETINSEIYNQIIAKRNIKKILDHHKQKQDLEQKSLRMNFKEKKYSEKCNNNFNFYKLFIILIEFSIFSLIFFIIIFIYTSLK